MVFFEVAFVESFGLFVTVGSGTTAFLVRTLIAADTSARCGGVETARVDGPLGLGLSTSPARPGVLASTAARPTVGSLVFSHLTLRPDPPFPEIGTSGIELIPTNITSDDS